LFIAFKCVTFSSSVPSPLPSSPHHSGPVVRLQSEPATALAAPTASIAGQRSGVHPAVAQRTRLRAGAVGHQLEHGPCSIAGIQVVAGPSVPVSVWLS